ncbi:MAG: MMPL family transporter [Solirubrobacterales bacterium]
MAVVAGVVGWSAPEHLSFRPGDFYSHGSESFEAYSELKAQRSKESLGVPDLAIIVRNASSGAESQVFKRLEASRLVAQAQGNVFPSRNGKSSYVLAWLKENKQDDASVEKVARELAAPGVMVGGPSLARHEFAGQITTDLRRAQIVAFPLLLLLGLWVFRSLVAAALPVSLGGFSVLIMLGIFRLTTDFAPLSVFSIDIALALALGLGVDYSLLMISRFREGLAAGSAPKESAAEALRTAGRTVAFSSAAIAASFFSLLVVPIPFVRSIAFGGGSVAIVTGLTALVLLPALLALLGHRVNALAPRAWQRSVARTSRPRQAGAWYRVARLATRRPVLVALFSGAILVVLAIPVRSMRFTGIDLTSLPTSASARQFSEEARAGFSHPLFGELTIAVHGDKKAAAKTLKKINLLGRRTHLGIPFPYSFERGTDLWEVRLNPTKPVFSSATQGLVSKLRGLKAPISVAGETAAYMDSATVLKHRLPAALAILVLSSIFFVFLATGSLVLPLKVLLMNALSLGAALGVTVAVFQDGRFEEVLNYKSQGALIVTLPLVVAAAAFGLLTDYGLFLLMRIKEERERGFSDREAIVFGLERTGRIITAAALLFCVAVGAFSTSELLLLKVAAIAIVVTVALDAFVVRPLLVPSLMAILGRWNWWPGRMPRNETGLSEQQP